MSEPLRILVVEDSAIFSLELEDRLVSLGHEVCGRARTVDQAIDMARQMQPDLMLVDINLSDTRDGTDVTSELANIPYIYVTAYSDETTVRKSYTPDCFGYLVKPISGDILSRTIEVAEIKVQQQRLRLVKSSELTREADEKKHRIRDARLRLETAYEERYRLLSDVSVDMFYPMTAVLNLMRLALAEDLDGTQMEQLQRIGFSSRRLLRQLQRVTLLLKPGNALAEEMHLTEVNLLELVQFTLREYAIFANDQGIKLDQPTGTGKVMQLDGAYLTLVLDTVIDNAIHRSSRRETVTTEIRVTDKAAEIMITDHGTMMDEAEQASLFVPFSKFNEPLEYVEGLGLEMALAARLATCLDGELSVHSSEDATCFRLALALQD